MNKYLKIGIWAVVVGVLLFAGLAYRGYVLQTEKQRTAEAIERINSRKITMADVMGEYLPAMPNEEINNATVAGVDANNNAIRDDVELAIFEKYPNSARIRSAMLQYAQALQLELTEVFNSETLVETLQKSNYSQSCISQAHFSQNLSGSEVSKLIDKRILEIQNLFWNTKIRRSAYADVLDYMTTYSVPAINQYCDINLSLFSN